MFSNFVTYNDNTAYSRFYLQSFKEDTIETTMDNLGYDDDFSNDNDIDHM